MSHGKSADMGDEIVTHMEVHDTTNVVSTSASPSGSEDAERQTSIADPTGRFERSNELLGRGASKEVYKAFDRDEGMEVAWNQLKVDYLTEQSAAKIISEIQILTQLDNENIIKFYHSWVCRNKAGNYDVFFITELMTSGTLKNYLQKTKGAIKLKIIKNWCRQILKALHYLHTKIPPIIHRDLKCDNIFINGNNGQAKLGDFGLAVLKDREMLTSVLGTPEFMAPELYEESYDEKVDIYAFGLCLLEMVTKDYPYSECDNAAQIYRKVTQGIKPMALTKVTDPETLEFIEMCINPISSKRPTVEELLCHDFMQVPTIVGLEADGRPLSGNVPDGTLSAVPSPTTPPTETMMSPVPIEGYVEGTTPVRTLAGFEPKLVGIQVDVISLELPAVNLKMKLLMSVANANKEVKFPFDFERDTVAVVVEEMIKENVLMPHAGEQAAAAIRDSIKEPLVMYEMARANAPARAELNETTSPTSLDAISISPAPPLPASAGSDLSSGTMSSISTQSIAPAFNEKVADFSEPIENEHLVQDHPEVAALLLKQKKEIELLALFHRREHQELLKKLRRQICGRSRNDSQSSTLPVSPVGIAPPAESDETVFIDKVRHLMYESTGNIAWLPGGVVPAPNNGSNGCEP